MHFKDKKWGEFVLLHQISNEKKRTSVRMASVPSPCRWLQVVVASPLLVTSAPLAHGLTRESRSYSYTYRAPHTLGVLESSSTHALTGESQIRGGRRGSGQARLGHSEIISSATRTPWPRSSVPAMTPALVGWPSCGLPAFMRWRL